MPVHGHSYVRTFLPWSPSSPGMPGSPGMPAGPIGPYTNITQFVTLLKSYIFILLSAILVHVLDHQRVGFLQSTMLLKFDLSIQLTADPGSP